MTLQTIGLRTVIVDGIQSFSLPTSTARKTAQGFAARGHHVVVKNGDCIVWLRESSTHVRESWMDDSDIAALQRDEA